MLPTRLSPVTVDINILCLRQLLFLPYVVSLISLGRRDKRHHTGDADDGTMFTRVVRTAGTGYRPDEGPANASGGSWF